MGAHLLLRLLGDGETVRALYRDGSDRKRVQRVFAYYADNAGELFSRIQWAKADLNDIPALEAAFNEVHTVYHVAALISFDPRDYKRLMDTNARGTANIVNLCLANKVKKLGYVSTIGTIGKGEANRPADEESEWSEARAYVYARSKYAAETEVWRGIQEGLPAVIINPGVVVGPGFWGSGSGSLFTAANKGRRFYPPGGTGFVAVQDVVSILVQLVRSSITNERYIVVAGNRSYKDVLILLAQRLRRPVPKVRLRYWQLEIARLFDWLASSIGKGPRRITRNTIYSLRHRGPYTSAKVKKTLDFSFEPLERSFDFCCRKFLEDGAGPDQREG